MYKKICKKLSVMAMVISMVVGIVSVADKAVSAEDLKPVPADLQISYDHGIVVRTNDTEFLAGIAAVTEDYHDSGIWVDPYSPDSGHASINNYGIYHPIVVNGNELRVSEENLINFYYLPAGEYTLRLKAFSKGYQGYSSRQSDPVITITITNGQPTDIPVFSVSQDGNGDLLITSSADHLKSLKTAAVYDGGYIIQAGGKIAILSQKVGSADAVKSDPNDTGVFTGDLIDYTDGETTAVISLSNLKKKGLTDGTYTIWLVDSKYGRHHQKNLVLDLSARVEKGETAPIVDYGGETPSKEMEEVAGAAEKSEINLPAEVSTNTTEKVKELIDGGKIVINDTVLSELGVSDASKIKIVAETSMKMQIEDAVTDESGGISNFTIDITPVYTVKAVSKENPDKSVVLQEPQKIETNNTPVEVKVYLPADSFKAGDKIWVKHNGKVLANGTEVKSDEKGLFITFTNPDGFSPFLFSKKPLSDDPVPTPDKAVDDDDDKDEKKSRVTTTVYKLPKTGISE